MVTSKAGSAKAAPKTTKATKTTKAEAAPAVKSVKPADAVVKRGNRLYVDGKPKNVAEYLIVQINLSDKGQAEIANEVGFNTPNMITMLKKNLTKLPIDKVGAMAKSLGVDPVHLYKMCMAEYYPQTWAMIEGFLDQPVLTESELEIVKTIRESNVVNPKLRTEEDKQRLLEFVNTLKSDSQ